MKKLSGSSYTLIVLMIAVVVLMVLSLQFAYFASKMLPLVVGSVVFVLAAVALVKGIISEHNTEVTATTNETDVRRSTLVEARAYLRVGAWIFGFALAIYLVGFFIAIPLFIAAYMKKHGSSWLSTILTAVIFDSIIYTVFTRALRVDFYHGIIPLWLGF